MADLDAGVPLISGDDCMMRLFVDSQRFGEDLLVSAEVKPNTTKYRDDHMGNRFSRVDMRLWGWDLSLRFHYKTDRMLNALLNYYNALSAPGARPVVLGIMLAVQERNAAAQRPGYLFTPVAADYNLSLPGMKERLTQAVDCYAERCLPYRGL